MREDCFDDVTTEWKLPRPNFHWARPAKSAFNGDSAVLFKMMANNRGQSSRLGENLREEVWHRSIAACH